MVGMWDSEEFESDMEPFPCHEFVHLLEGSLTITEGNGSAYEFQKGDVFFVPEGAICSLKADTYIKKFYTIFDANTLN